MAMRETQETSVKGEFSTAEVTHVLEAIRLEGQCYIKNHLLMMLSGQDRGVIREWHDNVTKVNLSKLQPIAKEMGIALPFPKPLEDRENEIKSKFQGAGPNMRGILTEGEAISEIKTAGVFLAEFYTTSMCLATHDRVRDAFRSGFENVADNLPRVLQGLQNTDNFYPPPIAKNVGLIAPKGVSQGRDNISGGNVGDGHVVGKSGSQMGGQQSGGMSRNR
ncbi:MAG TPA: hypothetical protein VNZ52_09920 [Candidatus Thermoplasmatota archaeon]|nr:hypothetical protein [Candidatus Thermoplasmatota archaeon]